MGSTPLEVGIESAYAQARKSHQEGGIPIGAALLIGNAVVAVGHNQRVQRRSNILHGEMDCIENAHHAFDLTNATLFTSLSPCRMCASTMLLFRIPRLVILDDINTSDFQTSTQMLAESGVEITVVSHLPSIELNRKFQTEPQTRRLWMGDVGK